MAAPTEQDFIDLKNTVLQLQQAQADKWLHDLTLLVIGAVLAAVPTIILAILSNRWNKRLFFLTKDKDEQMFRLEEAREQSLIKSKIFGQIKVAETELMTAVSDVIQRNLAFNDSLAVYGKVDEERKNVMNETVTHNKIEAEKFARIAMNKKAAFLQLIHEYNYLVKDKKIDELVNLFSETGMTMKMGFDDMTVEQLMHDSIHDRIG